MAVCVSTPNRRANRRNNFDFSSKKTEAATIFVSFCSSRPLPTVPDWSADGVGGGSRPVIDHSPAVDRGFRRAVSVQVADMRKGAPVKRAWSLQDHQVVGKGMKDGWGPSALLESRETLSTPRVIEFPGTRSPRLPGNAARYGLSCCRAGSPCQAAGGFPCPRPRPTATGR